MCFSQPEVKFFPTLLRNQSSLSPAGTPAFDTVWKTNELMVVNEIGWLLWIKCNAGAAAIRRRRNRGTWVMQPPAQSKLPASTSPADGRQTADQSCGRAQHRPRTDNTTLSVCEHPRSALLWLSSLVAQEPKFCSVAECPSVHCMTEVIFTVT